MGRTRRPQRTAVPSPTRVSGRARVALVAAVATLAALTAWMPGGSAGAAPGPPVLHTTSLHAGPSTGGTEVWLYGTDIADATGVWFGTTPATSWWESFGTLNVTTPPHVVGDVPIIIETPRGTTSATMTPQTTWTYTEPGVPVIADIGFPASGSEVGGTVVDLYGYDFEGVTSVRFGDVPAPIISAAGSQIRVTAPRAAAAGPVHVTVVTPVGSSPPVVDAVYTYTEQPPPTIQYLQPRATSAAGGGVVGIRGVGFTDATRVEFGAGNDAISFSVYDDQNILAVAPPAPGPNTSVVNVFVTTPEGTTVASSASHAYYTGPPTVSSLQPRRGSTTGGTTVTIDGSRLGGVTSVRFGGVEATSFTVESNRRVTAVAPPHVAGSAPVTVTTLNGTSAASLASLFTYDAPGAPVVTAVTPNVGPIAGGGTVTVTGSGFTGTTSVAVGSASATFTVDSPTQITVVVPPRGAAGLVNVTVRRSGSASASGPAAWYRYQ